MLQGYVGVLSEFKNGLAYDPFRVGDEKKQYGGVILYTNMI